MNMYIEIAISFTILLLSTINLRANHIVGGHIELKSIGKMPGKFRNIMKLNLMDPTQTVKFPLDKRYWYLKKSNTEFY